jgi:hypothetical protein
LRYAELFSDWKLAAEVTGRMATQQRPKADVQRMLNAM